MWLRRNRPTLKICDFQDRVRNTASSSPVETLQDEADSRTLIKPTRALRFEYGYCRSGYYLYWLRFLWCLHIPSPRQARYRLCRYAHTKRSRRRACSPAASAGIFAFRRNSRVVNLVMRSKFPCESLEYRKLYSFFSKRHFLRNLLFKFLFWGDIM